MLNDLMLKVLTAAAKFNAQTGNWPKHLDELVPAYLKEIPADPYSTNGGTLQYRLTDKHPRVYSVGPDHKADTADDLVIGDAPAPATLPPGLP